MEDSENGREMETLPDFSSLPEDIVLNCLARVSRIYNPTLSLVSRSFRSLIASPELEAARSRVGILREAFVCLDLNTSNPNPRWFILSQDTGRQGLPTAELLPLPPFPGEHPRYSTVLLVDSVIYIIGGWVGGNISNRVLLFDCRSHRWRSLPNMRHPRLSPAADVIDGKMYVIGGSYNNIDNWGGEVFDGKTQTWEPILPTAVVDLTAEKRNVVPGRLVMGGKEYSMHGLNPDVNTNVCLVDKRLRIMSFSHHSLFWNDPKEDLVWRLVLGLEGFSKFPYFHHRLNLLGNSDGGRKVIVWWRSVSTRREAPHYTPCEETKIWCAEVSFERRGLQELWGSVQWSENVLTIDGCHSPSDFLLHSVHC
ncbi:putative F-box/kelch-repeat protein At5g03000 isoform X2 [Capsella rubella]|uniref:putative F-box/kelch-repeat protein At5g03000 isoform X2 n=1 Tax=Capsella rubella TaxID=81985 RepID=UPI000CD4A142|nr:putative F-box/kelch-repeat protein At5g03000 isoform X2 [Capsella rubella]